MVGRTLEGRYRILGRIARGGMSVVYEAVDTRLDRMVAVKVMASALSADPKFRDRFSREARAAARLQHHNVVAVYDQSESSGVGGHDVFLVMELVEGRTLREVIREKGRFSPAEAVSIMEQVLSALSAAHRAGIVHRDVKPENILLSDDGVVKVADFGLARAVESDAESTRTGLMMGTVAYCSPEQITRGDADQRSDVYAAGIVLFELLTGTPPFTGENAMAVAYQHVHSRVPAPSSRVRDVPEPLDELVVNSTDSDPSGRPEDAAEFLAELHDVRTTLRLPVVAFPARTRTRRPQVPPVPPGPPGPPVARPAVANPTAPTAPDRVASLGRDTRQLQHPSHPGQPGPPPPVVIPPRADDPGRPPKQLTRRQRARRRSLIVVTIVVILALIGGFIGWWFGFGRYSKVPDVSGSSQQVAAQAIQDAGYKVGTVTAKNDHSAKVGVVLSTDPGGGDRVERGKTIDLVVSSGPAMVKVPKIVGGTEQQAQDALKQAGLTPEHDPSLDRFSTKVDQGVVIAAGTKTGALVEKGYTTVKYGLSKGPDWVQLPAVQKGASFDDVKAALEHAGVKVHREDVYDDLDAGLVISIDPTDRAVRGDTVKVTVSKGSAPFALPGIASGTPFDQAKAQLEGLGLTVQDNRVYGGILNIVVGMNPQAGTQVHKGDVITLDVA